MSTLPLPKTDASPSLSLCPDVYERSCEAPAIEDEHIAQLEQAVRNARASRRVAGYASFSGWSTLLAGAISLPFALSNIPMLFFCVSLAAIGTRELTLRRRLLRLETSAPKKLAINQLVLGITLAAYAVFMLTRPPGESMIASAAGSDPMLQSVPELTAQIDAFAQIEHAIKAGVYVLLIVVAVFVQGGTAIYYACNTGSLRRFHKHTPEWCVRVYRAVQSP